uniref:G_PROTEIN_RECEP_F1_2 domain-containing protein n=1 Tax=Heterorhabditis bacteriophora TaxID=37862 RepID=A0A1I7WLT2_HETBA
MKLKNTTIHQKRKKYRVVTTLLNALGLLWSAYILRIIP